MTRWLYPSHWRLDLMQLAQVGRSSPHLMRRLRQVKHPVFVLLRILVAAVEPEPLPVGDTSPAPPDGDLDWASAMVK
jgi:hypothetical protein